MCGQVPLMVRGDGTVPWPPQPATPAKRLQPATSARATCSPVCLLGCWGHPGVPLAASCGQSPGERGEDAACQPVPSNALAKVKVPCAPPGEPQGVPGRCQQRCTAAAPGLGQGGRHGRVPELSAPLCQHPVSPGVLREHRRRGRGCPRCIPPCPRLLPAGAAAPVPGVPGQSLPCAVAGRELAPVGCAGGRAGAGGSPGSSSGSLARRVWVPGPPPRQCSVPCAV